MRRTKYNNTVVHKFILVKIKKLISNNRGKPIFMDNFDTVIYDIFGVNHFAKKLNRVYDNRDFVSIIDSVGTDYLLEIMNSSKLFNIISELIAMDYRIKELRKAIRKSNKKGKRDKYEIKEYNYLVSLYKDSIKLLRKRFGIKNSKTAYKRKYKAINNMMHRNAYADDNDFSAIFMGDDDFFLDDDDDDDYDDGLFSDFDDYEETNELEDFVAFLNGRSSRRSPRRSSRRRSADIDFDLDDEDDDFDDYRGNQNNSDDYDDLSDQVKILASTVQDLTSNVQNLLMKDEYERTTKRRLNVADYHPQMNPQPSPRHIQPPTDTEILNGFVKKLSNEIVEMQKSNNLIAKAVSKSLDQQDAIIDALNGLYEEVEEDEADVVFREPVVSGSTINKYPDLYEELSTENQEYNPQEIPPTREELIDMINNSGESVPNGDNGSKKVVSEPVEPPVNPQ